MKRVVQLNIRITALLDDKINDYCTNLRLTRSSFVYKALMYYLSKKGFKVITDQLKYEKQKEMTREDNYRFYLIKNTFMTIINISKMDLLLKGDINMDKIGYIIKNYKKIYNSFPPYIKRVLKDEMKTIEMLQHSSNLKQYINNWDLVQEFIHVNKDRRIEMK